MEGTLIKTMNGLNTGEAEVSIDSGELGPGMYLYTLIVDGKEIDTKRN